MRKRRLPWVKTLLASTILVSGLGVANAHDIKINIDTDDVTRSFDLSGFDGIDVSGVYELDITVGEGYSIELSGDEEEMDNVDIRVEDGVLYMGSKKKWKKKNRHGIDAVITLPKLNDMEVSGVASADIQGVDAENFELDVSGVAEVDIEGQCGSLDALVSGVGELDAEDLICDNVEVHLSGVGEVSVYADEFADVTASGMGEVDVYGGPERVKKDKSFFTSIDIHD